MDNPAQTRRSHRLIALAAPVLLALGLLSPVSLPAAEPHALLDRGFQADQIYDFNGIDDVNLFNGNLVVTIPIGQRYPLNAGFDYGFMLAYNSHIWDYLHDCPDNGKDELGEGQVVNLIDPAAVPQGCLRGIPNPKSNAGTSWRMTLGELYDMNSPLFPESGWVFVSPDGAEHTFGPVEGQLGDTYPQYSRGNSNLRLRIASAGTTPACIDVVGTCVAIDRPDGTVYAFEAAAGPAGWRLSRIQDPFGNWVSVGYGASEWTIDDSLGRSHTVTFDAGGQVATVTLAAFDNTTATYQFFTEASEPILPGCPHDFEIDGDSETEILSQLTALQLPDGSRYVFGYVDDDGFTGICSRYRGRLETIELPTGGRIAYAYGPYLFPASSCSAPLPRHSPLSGFFHEQWGITSRTVTGIAGDLLAQVRYANGGPSVAPSRQFAPGSATEPSVCIVPRTTFTDVYEKGDQGHYKLTRNFFSIAQIPAEGASEVWEPLEELGYGLPVDHLSADGRKASRYRSSMVFDCPTYPPQSQSYGPNCAFSTDPSCWPSSAQHLQVPTSCYEGDRFSTPEAVHGLRDSYLEHEPGLLHYCDGNFTTSPGCETGNWQVKSDLTYFYDSPGSFYVETTRSDPDGYGHYRTTISRSNSPGSVDHEVKVSYRPAVGPQAWLLGLSDGMTVTENRQTSQETYTFDRTTGFLETRTTHRSGGNLVATFTPDAFGNVETETYSGGDPGQPAYVALNEYRNGTLSRSEYVRSGRTILRTVDADIDAGTGLPAASRDESGLATAYSFDSMGRLTQMTPVGALAEAPTFYTYTLANPARSPADKRASVTITRGDAHSQIFFDGLGRPNEAQTTLPNGTVSRRFTTFTPMGQPDTVTTLHPKNQPGTAKTTRTDYDVFGRPTRIRNPDDGLASTGVSQTFMTYDGIFKTVRWIKDVETPEGAQKLLTKYFYDHQGRLLTVEETDSDGADTDLKLRTRYLYDEGGRLVQVNQGGGTQTRTFDYDAAGLLTKERHPELGGGSITYSGYDALGNATHLRYSKTGGAPFELDYRFDGAGRLTQVRSAQGPERRLLKEFFYNNFYGSVAPPSPAAGNGKLYQAKRHNYVGPLDIVATVTHTYAGFGGRLSRRTVTTGGDGDVPRVRFATDFAYDSLGNPTSTAYPSCLQAGCDGSVPGRQVTRTFTRGLLTGVGTSANATRYAALSYHPNATVAQVLHGNGVRDVIAQDLSQLPRPAGIEVRTGATAGAGTLWDADYQYDGAGNVASRTSHGFNGAGAQLFSGTDLFRYDNAFNRLVSATVHYPAGAGGATESQEFEYDAFGNLASVSGSTPRTLSPDPTSNRLASPFTYDDAGNLTSQPGWDASGNPTATAAWYYDYDPLNMMVHAQKAGGSIDRRFLYTADDERLAILTPGRELWTLRDAGNSVLRDVEYLSTGWRWVEDYVRGTTGLLATVESVGGEKHYHLDHLGTPRLVTNLAKQVVARHVLAPYGEELTSTNQDELRMKFTGHERDAMDPFDGDGDLDYMHARFCSPQLGRFLSTDPKNRYHSTTTPQQWNRYAYALSNPVKFLDPDGREIELASESLRSFLVSTLTRPTGRGILTRLDKSSLRFVFRDVKLNSDSVTMAARRGQLRSQKVHFEAIGEILSTTNERTGITVSIDSKAVALAHPTDTTGVTTAAHGAHHAEAAAEGMSIEDVRATGDFPSSAEGPAEQFGQAVAAEPPDITEEEANKLLDQLLETTYPPE